MVQDRSEGCMPSFLDGEIFIDIHCTMMYPPSLLLSLLSVLLELLPFTPLQSPLPSPYPTAAFHSLTVLYIVRTHSV